MNDSFKIHCTKKYENFQFYKCNRDIYDAHVQTFIDDKTFPDKFQTSPIVVNSDFMIIEGQHRFTAAKKLNIPIYYIIDENATDEDIKIRNTNVKPWKIHDHIKFYSEKGIKSYQYLSGFMKEYKITPSFLCCILRVLDKRHFAIFEKFRSGLLDIENYVDLIREFLSIYVPVIKKCRHRRGVEANSLFSKSYVQTFFYYFVKDRENVFDKAIKKLEESHVPLTYYSSLKDAKEGIKKISSWRKPKVYI